MENEASVEYLELMVKPLTLYPDQVRVTRTQDDLGILLTIDLHKDDMGRIIGKEGSTVNAIRQLVRAYGLSHQSRISVKINEPEGSTRFQQRQAEPSINI